MHLICVMCITYFAFNKKVLKDFGICQYDLRSGLLLICAKNRDESLSEHS